MTSVRGPMAVNVVRNQKFCEKIRLKRLTDMIEDSAVTVYAAKRAAVAVTKAANDDVGGEGGEGEKSGESRFGFRARVGIRPKAGKNPGCGAGGRGLRGAGGGAIDAARQDASMSGRNIGI